jgi:glycosyltransferase involved in cell wall biosynthesis
MKIGFICQPFDSGVPPDPGGSIGLLTWELARRLSRSFQVVVCAPDAGRQPAHEQWEGVQFDRIRLRADRWLLDKPRGLKGPVCESRKDIDSFFYYPIYAAQAALNLRAKGCDVIHIHNFTQFLPIARLFNPKTKIVLHMHCDWLADFDRELIEWRLRHADLIVGCADYITNRVRSRFPQYADRCFTLYNGANIGELADQFCQPRTQHRKRFLFAGRVSPEKGIHVLLDAYRMVLAREPEAELTIVGGAYIPPLSFLVDRSGDPMVRELRRFYTSDYLEHLQEEARTIPEGRVSFLGQVAHSELAALLKDADVFMQPSVWGEPFPLAVVEAMAAGLPVIASRIGGLPESVVDGNTGLLVQPDDPTALADAMLQLIRNKRMAHSMGTAGAIRAREMFSWEVITARLSSLYEALTSESPLEGVLRTRRVRM